MNSTQAWVTYLSKVELPVLANTLKRINELTDSRNSTVNELANVILNDAQLTSQVLRLSNTVFYNQTRTQVSTVSRVITLIGFDAVKSMAISSLIVDALLKRNDRPHLLRCSRERKQLRWVRAFGRIEVDMCAVHVFQQSACRRR